MIETDDGSESVNKRFTDFLNNNNIKRKSRYTSLRDVFAERFIRTITDLFKRPDFERGDANWIDILPTITKQYNNKKYSSNKLTPIQASLKKNEGFAYNKSIEKRIKKVQSLKLTISFDLLI